nr:putative holin-like toxin [Lacrimispora sp.]
MVRMKYEFKDLMAFGMFIIALLTFIFAYCKQRFSIKSRKRAIVNHKVYLIRSF